MTQSNTQGTWQTHKVGKGKEIDSFLQTEALQPILDF